MSENMAQINLCDGDDHTQASTSEGLIIVSRIIQASSAMNEPPETAFSNAVTASPNDDGSESLSTDGSSGCRLTSTFELLEAILLHLPAKELFRAQRCNRTFKDTISNSKRLQRKLYAASGLRLSATPRVLEKILLHSSMEDVLCRHQRVNKAFSSTITNSVPLQRMLFLIPVEDVPGRNVVAHPLLNRISRRLSYRKDYIPSTYTYARTYDHTITAYAEYPVAARVSVYAANPEKTPRFQHQLHQPASWQRMYLSQPPRDVLCDVIMESKDGVVYTADVKRIAGTAQELWKAAVWRPTVALREVRRPAKGEGHGKSRGGGR
ncbi:hypothetical protein LTR17_001308 [Elasticomyces elasticus]|nr:hypothetical protein LTR17_001308 [Elasticomyces elasticus]